MLESFLFAFWTILPIVNPLGALGPFLTMTARDDITKRRKVAFQASIVMACVLAVCTLSGSFFFRFFGITVPALKVAGGILLLLVSIDMLNVRQSRTKATSEEEAEGIQKEDIAVFPLAIPLLSGPGSIVSVLMLADRATTLYDHLFILLAILMTALIVWVLLREAHRVSLVLGKIGLSVLSRLMGLVLAAIAVQFIFDGMRAGLPGLAGS